ncbi:MAG: GNAT family N-acetyltransferase [Bacteroidales bacterium]
MDVEFVEYTLDFLELSWNWLNDEEIRRLTDTPQFNQDDQLLWFESLKFRKDYMIWGIKAFGEKVGACGIKNITSDECEFWGYIGERNYWGLGVGVEMMKFVENKVREINRQCILLSVLVENKRAISLYEKMNYVFEKQQGDLVLMRKYL